MTSFTYNQKDQTMNLESNPSKKTARKVVVPSDDFDFDFKPITSGLGFHSQKTTEIKPAFQESMSSMQISQPVVNPSLNIRKDAQVYQNDLSIFYNREAGLPAAEAVVETKTEKTYRLASKPQRIMAYLLDLSLIASILGIVLTIMARLIDMDLMEVWTAYPNEITPLVVTLFCGFYLIYFSIFEKTFTSTMGKSLLNLRVVNQQNRSQSFSYLLLRSFVSLTNFLSLGLFSYFDLQNKVTSSKVIKVD
jgi:uncharacterized RDD family membrane protein YckC